jgi:hypothetical protein
MWLKGIQSAITTAGSRRKLQVRGLSCITLYLLYGGKIMEPMDVITQIVSTVGFPIAMAIALFWYMTKQMETHKQEMNDLRDVIAKNNEILAGLKQLIEDRVKD